MIQEHIRQKILEEAFSLEKFGLNDLTWEKESAQKLITSLLDDDIGIWGGNVYQIDSDRLIAMPENWASIPIENEAKKDFFLRSKIESLEYINKFSIYLCEKILFSLGFIEYFF